MTNGSPPALSVVVASYNSPATLRRCLEALSRQPLAHEIVVADCSPEDPAAQLSPLYPSVRFLHFAEQRTIPQLRWAAYQQTSGSIVAATEGRCIPAPDWCEQLVRFHESAPDAPAVGGPITVTNVSSAFDIGVYFCEYGLHSPPIANSYVRLASGANVSYKRADVERCRDLVESGAWETLLHQRWLDQNRPLRMSDALVCFENAMDLQTVLQQRFHYGRGYAADRVDGAPLRQRALYAGFCLVLPFLMVWRLAHVAKRKGRLAEFLRASLWVLLLSAVWAAGEAAGYLFGKSSVERVF